MSSITVGGVLSGLSPTSWTVTEQWRGWSASLGFANLPARLADTGTASVSVDDDQGGSLSLPPMVVGPRERDHERKRKMSVSLLDETSWLLGSGSHSWDTFLGGSTTDIVAAVASTFGITCSGTIPNWPIYQEDFKLVNGWAVFDRLERVDGGDILISTGGDVVWVPAGWTSGNSSWRGRSAKDRHDPMSRYGRIFVSKNLGIGTFDGPQHYTFTDTGNVSVTLSYPLGPGAYPTPEPGIGNVGYVTLWDGPPNSGGQALGTWPLIGDSGGETIPPPTGTWPATHMTAIVYPDTISSLPTKARVRINGTPFNDLPAGIDGAIAKEFGTGRGAPYAFSDSLIPSLSFAASRSSAWLAKANRGTNTMTAAGPLDCSLRVGQVWSWPPFGLTGRIERVTHSGGGRVPSSDILVNCDVGG